MSSLTKKNSDTSLKFVYSDNNSLSVIFHDNELLIGVVGEFNKNLKELEKITETSLYSRGNSILINYQYFFLLGCSITMLPFVYSLNLFHQTRWFDYFY